MAPLQLSEQIYEYRNISTVEKMQKITGAIYIYMYVYLTLSAHAREGYSSHFVCHSLFDFGEGAVFRVETYIDTF